MLALSPQPSTDAHCRQYESSLLEQVPCLGPQRIRREQAPIRHHVRRADGRNPGHTASFRRGDPARHEGERFRCAHWTLLRLVNVVAVETQTSGPELHTFNLRRSSAKPAIGCCLLLHTRTRLVVLQARPLRQRAVPARSGSTSASVRRVTPDRVLPFSRSNLLSADSGRRHAAARDRITWDAGTERAEKAGRAGCG